MELADEMTFEELEALELPTDLPDDPKRVDAVISTIQEMGRISWDEGSALRREYGSLPEGT